MNGGTPDGSQVAPSPERFEAQFRFIVENTTEAVWRVSTTEPVSTALPADEQIALFYQRGVLAECNPGMARMYGFASPEDMVGLGLGELMPSSEPANIEYLRRFIREGYRLVNVESVERDAEGRPKYLRNNLVGILKDGCIHGAIGTSQDITEYRIAREREKLLADAGEVFNVSLDYVRTLSAVAKFLVPRFADWCAIDLVSEAGELERVAVCHQDPAKVQLATTLFREYPPRRTDPRGAWRVIETGEPDWGPHIPDELLASVAHDARHLELLRGLGLVSFIVAPISARGTTLGVLTLVTAESLRNYRVEDLAIARSLAERAAMAVENARLYQRSQHDLARLREAEEALEEREQRLRLITDAMPALISYLDTDGFYRFANQQYQVWFGQPASALIGRHMQEVLGDEAYSVIQPNFARAVRGERLSYEAEAPYSRGGARFVSIHYVPDHANDGSVRGVFALIMDITESKRQERALRESEERLRRATAASQLVIWEMDALTRVVHCTENAREIWGITIADADAFFRRVHPEDRDRVMQESESMLLGGRSYSSEYRVINPAGDVRWVHSRGDMVTDERGRARFVGITADITERKRAEEALRASALRLRRIIDSNVVGLILADFDGKVHEANDSFLQMLGYTREDFAEGRINWVDLTPPEWRHMDERAMDQMSRSGRHDPFEKEYIRKDGTRVPVLIGTAFLPDEKLGVGFIVDLTAQKQTEHALRQSETRFRQLADAMPQLVWTASSDGVVDYYNQRLSQYSGATQTADGQWRWEPLLHPDDVPGTAQAWEKAVAAGATYEFTHRVRMADGTFRWHLSRAVPVLDEQGRLVKWFGTATDIDAQKHAEQAVRDSEAVLRTLAEAVPTLVWVAAVDGSILYLNARWTEYTGQTPEAARGLGWAETLHPDDRPELLRKWEHCTRTGEPYEGECRYRRRDGEYRWHFYRGLPLREADGRINAWYGASIDIHERKLGEQALRESEVRFREMADTAPAMLWITESSGQCTFLSRGWFEFTGQTEEEALGVGWSSAVHPEDRAGVELAFIDANQRGVSFQYECRLRRHDGVYRWVIDAARPRFSSAGEFLGMIGSVIDVHERKVAEEQLRASHAELDRKVNERTARLRETVGELEAFSYSISHDLRAPLRAMTGYAQALKDDCAEQLDAEHREYLDRISRAAQRLDRLINDVLDYSRLSRTEVTLSPVNVEHVLDDILQQYPPLHPEHARVTVHRPIPPVLGHEALLVQSLSNLLINAAKFVKPGVFPDIHVRARRERNRVIIEVQDNGIGIAPHNLTRVFGLFQRVNPDAAYEGTGIGLSIVKKAIERLGGNVSVESQENIGSTFRIELRAA
jgi:PAS domain S-box-containing protein